MINYICRSFLWFGIAESQKPGKVNLLDVCKPKKFGGLGIFNLLVWNQVGIGKITWHICCMKDSLWVWWVHGIYTKGGKWGIFNAPPTASWVIKRLGSVNDLLWHWINRDTYSIKGVYVEMLNLEDKMQWRNLVWNRYSIPKIRIICWLMALGNLRTKDKLHHFGVTNDDLCPLCAAATKIGAHQFFECLISKLCLDGIKQWTWVKLKPVSILDTRRLNLNRFQQQILFSSIFQ